MQSSLAVRIARVSWVENSNKKYKQVVIHIKAGLHLARAIVGPISKENIRWCNRLF